MKKVALGYSTCSLFTWKYTFFDEHHCLKQECETFFAQFSGLGTSFSPKVVEYHAGRIGCDTLRQQKGESRQRDDCWGHTENIFQVAWKNYSMLFESAALTFFSPVENGFLMCLSDRQQLPSPPFYLHTVGNRRQSVRLPAVVSAVLSRAPKFNGS